MRVLLWIFLFVKSDLSDVLGLLVLELLLTQKNRLQFL